MTTSHNNKDQALANAMRDLLDLLPHSSDLISPSGVFDANARLIHEAQTELSRDDAILAARKALADWSEL